MQRTADTAGETGPVEEDAGVVPVGVGDHPGVGPGIVGEHAVGGGLGVELEPLGVERGRERRGQHRLVDVEHLGPDRTAPLLQLLRGLVEDPEAAVTPLAAPVG